MGRRDSVVAGRHQSIHPEDRREDHHRWRSRSRYFGTQSSGTSGHTSCNCHDPGIQMAGPRSIMMPKFRTTFVIGLLVLAPVGLFAQGGRGGGGAPPAAAQGPKAAAPVDLTGYWVSIVTEDWIERMSPDSPPSGTGGARGLGNRGPEVAPAGADPCRVYGAGGSMRVPGRVHITWADDNTLKVEMDAGTQTRLFHFSPTTPAPTEKTLQGYSVANWEVSAGARGGGRGGAPGAGAPPTPPAPRWGSLNVSTANMSSGYLLS